MATYVSGARLTAAAESVTDVAVEVSLHSSEPDSEGSNELSGGGYERQSVSWGSGAEGLVTAEDELQFSVPGDGTWVRFAGLWDDSGAFLVAIELDTQVEYPAAGTYTVTPLQFGARIPTGDGSMVYR